MDMYGLYVDRIIYIKYVYIYINTYKCKYKYKHKYISMYCCRVGSASDGIDEQDAQSCRM